MALTATATPEVQSDIIQQLGLEPETCRRFHQGIGRPNLELRVTEVWGSEEKLHAIAEPMRRYASGIVYFSLIRSLEAISEQLVQHGPTAYGLSWRSLVACPESVQDAFMSGESSWVLATNALAWGSIARIFAVLSMLKSGIDRIVLSRNRPRGARRPPGRVLAAVRSERS